MADRNIAMELANALAKADSQSLAQLGFELLESLGEARATLAVYEAAEQQERDAEAARAAARRARDRERKRVRRFPAESTGVQRNPADSLDGSPDPSLNPTTTPSSSARDDGGWRPVLETRLAARLPSDAGRNALTVVLKKCGDKVAVVSEIGMVLDGGRNCSADPAHVESALCDFAANEPKWASALFRAYVERAAKGETPRPAKRSGGVGERSYQNAKEALQ